MELEGRIQTTEQTRAKYAEALGFTQPSALDLVERSKYGSEESYIDAAVRAEMERSDPKYRETRARILSEYRQRQEREERERQTESYNAILQKVQLDFLDEKNVMAEAERLASLDLHANRIGAGQLAETIEKYKKQLTEKRKAERASSLLFNAMLRGE